MTHCTISPKKCSMCVIQSTFHSTIIYTCVYTTVLEYVCHGWMYYSNMLTVADTWCSEVTPSTKTDCHKILLVVVFSIPRTLSIFIFKLYNPSAANNYYSRFQIIGQTWGQLLSNVIDYITITLQFSWLHYIMITSIFKCNRLNYNHFVNVIDYITDYI